MTITPLHNGTLVNQPTVMKTWPAVRRTASRLLRLHHFYRPPAEVVVMRRNPLLAHGGDAFLPFGSRRNRQETFLVVVLYLGPLPSHAELAADFSKALLHRVVYLLLKRTKLSDMNGKNPYARNCHLLTLIHITTVRIRPAADPPRQGVSYSERHFQL